MRTGAGMAALENSKERIGELPFDVHKKAPSKTYYGKQW